MTNENVLNQFNECILSLEEEIVRIGTCDDAALDLISDHDIKPEFYECVGKLCTFPSLSEFLSPSSPLVSEKEKDKEKVGEKRAAGRFAKKRKISTPSESEDVVGGESEGSTPSKPAVPSPRRSKRAKKE